MSWPHAPSKIVKGPGMHIITSGTYQKAHLFDNSEKLKCLEEILFETALRTGWELQAWALFSNHYHLVGFCPTDHGASAQYLNKLDNTPGRKVWYRCRDTMLTNEKSYLARLNYVHTNSRKHLNIAPENYPYCSMHWFNLRADRSFFETVMSFPSNDISIEDDF